MKNTLLLFLLSISCTILSAQENNWKSKVDDSLLNKLAETDEVEFLVVLKDKANLSLAKSLSTKNEKAQYVYASLKSHADKSQKDLKTYLDAEAVPYQSLFIVNVLKLSGDYSLLETIANRTDIKRVMENPSVSFSAPIRETAPLQKTLEWGLERIGVDQVWQMGIRGEGVVVGGQDTGYEWTHPAIVDTYRGNQTSGVDHNYNWHDAIHEISPLHNDSIPDPSLNPCGLDVDYPCDDHNHGTHTMGTMVGLDGENEIGVAPESEWCACRSMERGYGTPFTYLECFQWFVAPTDLNNENADPSKAPHVIANSWGCPEMEGCNPDNFYLLEEGVDNLKAAGTVVVVSAGNDGSECSSISKPASMFENSFSVGATNAQDTIAGFSSRGPVIIDDSGRTKPNISAPGVQVRSCIRDSSYATWSGTSMAGPHVAGVVALMISANPDLAGHVDTIEHIIERTAVQLATEQECGGLTEADIPNNTYGYGRIDALAAVEMAMATMISSASKIDNELVNVFPNPTTGILFVDSNGTEISDLRLIAVSGKMQEVSLVNNQIDISNLPEGAYVLQFRIGETGQTISHKMVMLTHK